MAGRRRRRRIGASLHDDSDPLGAIANLFDVAMVFAVALMVAMVSRWQLTEFLTQEDFTMVKNPGTEEMEIITQEAGEITRYRAEDVDDAAGRRGRRVGIAYQLESGEITLRAGRTPTPAPRRGRRRRRVEVDEAMGRPRTAWRTAKTGRPAAAIIGSIE